MSYALLSVPRLQRRTVDSAVWLSLFGGLALSALVALGAPLLGALFGASSIGPLIAFGGIKLALVGAGAVPQQRLARGLRHRELAAANAVSTLVSAGARVALAMLGFGAWAFVLAQHAYAFTQLVCMWALSPLRPRFRMGRPELETLLRLGLPASVSNSVALLARNLDVLFVSRWFGLDALGLYRVAFDLAMSPLLAIGDVIARSSTPTLQRLFRTPRELRATFAYAVRLSLLLCVPIALFTLALAPNLLALAKDASFVAAAPTVRVLAMAAVLLVVFGLYNPLAQALGHPELGLWSNLELFVLLATSLWLCLSLLGPFFSISAAGVAWCLALSTALLLTHQRFRRAVRHDNFPAFRQPTYAAERQTSP